MSRKTIISLSFIFAALASELFLWKYTLLMVTVLVFLALIKHKLFPIKKELFWYLLIFAGGAIFEVLIVNFGHGWTYNNPHFLGVPLWIPPFWGLLGTSIISFYEGLTSS